MDKYLTSLFVHLPVRMHRKFRRYTYPTHMLISQYKCIGSSVWIYLSLLLNYLSPCIYVYKPKWFLYRMIIVEMHIKLTLSLHVHLFVRIVYIWRNYLTDMLESVWNRCRVQLLHIPHKQDHISPKIQPEFVWVKPDHNVEMLKQLFTIKMMRVSLLLV